MPAPPVSGSASSQSFGQHRQATDRAISAPPSCGPRLAAPYRLRRGSGPRSRFSVYRRRHATVSVPSLPPSPSRRSRHLGLAVAHAVPPATPCRSRRRSFAVLGPCIRPRRVASARLSFARLPRARPICIVSLRSLVLPELVIQSVLLHTWRQSCAGRARRACAATGRR